MVELSEASNEIPHKLWVDHYAPRSYTDLLSEEVKVYFQLHFPRMSLPNANTARIQQCKMNTSVILV